MWRQKLGPWNVTCMVFSHEFHCDGHRVVNSFVRLFKILMEITAFGFLCFVFEIEISSFVFSSQIFIWVLYGDIHFCSCTSLQLHELYLSYVTLSSHRTHCILITFFQPSMLPIWVRMVLSASSLSCCPLVAGSTPPCPSTPWTLWLSWSSPVSLGVIL